MMWEIVVSGLEGREEPEEKELNVKRVESGAEVLGPWSQRLPLEEGNQSWGGTSYPGHDVIKSESWDQHSVLRAWSQCTLKCFRVVPRGGWWKRTLGSVRYSQSYRVKSHNRMTLSQGKSTVARSSYVKVFGGHLIKLRASGLNYRVGSVDLNCFFKPV